MKLYSVSQERIRELLELPKYEIIYTKGIPYFQSVNPDQTEAFYRLCVAEFVVEQCMGLFKRDESNRYTNEWELLDEVLKDVNKGYLFKVKESVFGDIIHDSKLSFPMKILSILLTCLLAGALIFIIIYVIPSILNWIIGLFK